MNKAAKIVFKDGVPSVAEIGRLTGVARQTIWRIYQQKQVPKVPLLKHLLPFLKECPCCERLTDDDSAAETVLNIRRIATVAQKAANEGKPISPQNFAKMILEQTGDA